MRKQKGLFLIKKFLITYFLLILFFITKSNAQAIKLAIVDFDNISGIAKYDGLGKAMSSMLISDIESNVSPKRLQLVERAQIQKIIKEQNFQLSGNVNRSTVIQTGKLLGVKYLLLGDVYILNDQLVINARLTNTETGDIIFSKKQEGKIIGWLSLKTSIAKELSTSLSMPFTEPRIIDTTIQTAVLTSYANAIDAKDKGNYDKAEILINTTREFNPGFGYLDDLKDDVERLKKQVAEQSKKIEVLEKSGGRVVNAKSYEELMLNLTNQLTSFDEKKKLFITIMNTYPDKWGKDGSGGYFDLFLNQYDLDQLGLNGCNLLLNDILKSRENIRKESLNFFDKSIYVFLGWSLNSVQKKVHWKHEFSDEDFIEFKRLTSLVISNAFKSTAEQLFAHFIIFSNFNNDLKQFNVNVKKQILFTHKNIYDLLNFPFGTQIVEQAKNSSTKEEDIVYYRTKSKLLASENVIVFLSAKHDDYKNVIKLYKSFNIMSSDSEAFSYYYKNEDENTSSNQMYMNDMKGVFDYFSIPSFNRQDPYLNNYGVIILNEFPNIIPLSDITKKSIVKLDSSTRRYERIMSSLRSQNVSDPCYINLLRDSLIRVSDSIAIVSNVYVLNNKFKIGSRVELFYNSNNEKIMAYVIGKKMTNTAAEFEIIDNKTLKNIDTNQVIKYKRNEQFHSEDLEPKYINASNQQEFENSAIECEKKKKYEADQNAREAYFKKQADEYKQKNENKLLAYNNKINTVISLFANKSIPADTVSFQNLITQVYDDEIGLDSIFNLAFNLLVGGSKNLITNRKSNTQLDVQLSLLLNLYFIYEIEDRDINQSVKQNWMYAANINLAHGYLLSSNKFGINGYKLAAEEYSKVPINFKFDKSFNSFTRNNMIFSDWNDFILKGAISKSQIEEFNKIYKIGINF